jgi:alkanesulfonate monooxygenase SsuD/methylene tetrahydromethanopterin reductase-like flavin-dependent oxidoreductase (luciferase family)
MKVGICLPYMKENLDRATMIQWCQRIDEGPFHSLSCGERITGPTLEMRAVLAMAAALTERVRINASLYVLPMHDAVWAAKEIATLDVLSGGRMDITVGVGGRELDYKAVGASFAKRHQRMDEQVATMKSVWAGNPPFVGIDPVGPTPLQAGGPPILAGAMGPKSMARCAQWADGVYAFSMNGEREEMQRLLSLADDAWSDAGREKRPYKLGGCWYTLAPENAQQKMTDYVYSYLKIMGDDIAKMVADSMTRFTPDGVNQALDIMEDLGCEEVFMVPATAEIAEVDGLAELLAKR